MAAMSAAAESSEQHEFALRLGTTLAPTGGPAEADHFLPAGMRFSPSQVPLETPRPVAA